MEHDLGAEVGEQLPDPALVADVGDDQLVGVEQGPAVELQLQPVQVGLVVVEQVQRLWSECGDLAAELAADRPTRPGDQHAPSGDHGAGGGPDHPDLLPAEEPVDVQAAQVADADVALEGGDEGRQVADAGPGGRAGDGQLADLDR